jgi:cytochrome P450
MVRQVLIGGFDSTSIALATAVWWLAEHPQDAQRLRDTPKLIDKASEEIVRFASPASYLRRTVTKDVALGGTQLHEGDWVVLAFGAANRDPNVFECPDRVVLDRSPNHHLGFGSGVHRCIGSFLAKLEMRVALEEILRRYREIKLDTSQPIQYCSGLNQGIMALPVILTAA